VERNERGWIERRREEYCAVSIVTCGYCGEEGTAEGGNFMRMEYVHNMWCERCRPKKEWLEREVAIGRKSKMRCTACGKKWMAVKKEEVKAGECNKCEDVTVAHDSQSRQASSPCKGLDPPWAGIADSA